MDEAQQEFRDFPAKDLHPTKKIQYNHLNHVVLMGRMKGHGWRLAQIKKRHSTQMVLVASAEFNLSLGILLQIDSITPYTTTFIQFIFK